MMTTASGDLLTWQSGLSDSAPMMDLSWSQWIFCAHKLIDQDVSTLAKTDFGGPANFDFDAQSFGTDAQGQRWYSRQHNRSAGRLYFQLSSLDKAQNALGAQRVKQVTDCLPRRCRGVMHMDYICREELDGGLIDDQLDDADQEYFYDLVFKIASYVHLNWRWPTVVGFYRPSDDRFDVVPIENSRLVVADQQLALSPLCSIELIVIIAVVIVLFCLIAQPFQQLKALFPIGRQLDHARLFVIAYIADEVAVYPPLLGQHCVFVVINRVCAVST